MPRKTLIHIGYHKTASTWLQTQFFNHPDLQFNMPIAKREIKDKILFPHPFSFEEKEARSTFEQKLTRTPDEQTSVISMESISGSFFSDGSDGIERANKMKSVFPNAAILINIREQQSMLRSSYKHYVKALGTLSVAKWLAASNTSKKRLPVFSPIRFHYHHLILHYQSLFGVDNVLVLPCEQLWQTPELYVQRISEFAGITLSDDVCKSLNYTYKSNKGLSAYTANIKRHLNRIIMHDIVLNPNPICPVNLHPNTLKRWTYRIDRRIPEFLKLRSEKKLIEIIGQYTGKQFQESNRITAELTGLNLEEYGYDV
jgi:hypothetical protein